MPFQDPLGPPAPSALFLVLTGRPGSEPVVRSLIHDMSAIVRAVSFSVPHNLSVVMGIGADLWDRMYDAPKPPGLHAFAEIVGPTRTAVSTPGDLLFHLRSDQFDAPFTLASRINDRLRGHADIVDEVHGWKFYDERDLLGFIDGSANPVDRMGEDTVFVEDPDPLYHWSSYVVVQKYLHDLDAWSKLTVEQQERVIDRTKLTDIEFPDDVKAPNSHVAVNEIYSPEGRPRRIVRDNRPFGALGDEEFGTYFIGYSKDPSIQEEMLRRMYLGVPDGGPDMILDYSIPKTGGLFFVPTIDWCYHQPPAVTASS